MNEENQGDKGLLGLWDLLDLLDPRVKLDNEEKVELWDNLVNQVGAQLFFCKD